MAIQEGTRVRLLQNIYTGSNLAPSMLGTVVYIDEEFGRALYYVQVDGDSSTYGEDTGWAFVLSELEEVEESG
jgi:hypothetical protein